MKTAPVEFTEWFRKMTKSLGVREAARKIGVSHPTVSGLLDGVLPSEGTCVRISTAYDIPADYVLRKAGYLPPATQQEELVEKVLFELKTLPEEEYPDVVKYIQLRRQISEEKGTYEPKKGTATP